MCLIEMFLFWNHYKKENVKPGMHFSQWWIQCRCLGYCSTLQHMCDILVYDICRVVGIREGQTCSCRPSSRNKGEWKVYVRNILLRIDYWRVCSGYACRRLNKDSGECSQNRISVQRRGKQCCGFEWGKLHYIWYGFLNIQR